MPVGLVEIGRLTLHRQLIGEALQVLVDGILDQGRRQVVDVHPVFEVIQDVAPLLVAPRRQLLVLQHRFDALLELREVLEADVLREIVVRLGDCFDLEGLDLERVTECSAAAAGRWAPRLHRLLC